MEVCRERDTKGQYEKADSGEYRSFPGVSAEYEDPQQPDLVLNAADTSIDACAEAVIELLKDRGFIK